MDKRTFLKSLAGIPITVSPLLESIDHWLIEHKTENIITDESFWEKIRSQYDLKSDYINLENGYYCITPKPTIERYINHIKEVNREGSYYMRTIKNDNKDKIHNRLAELVNADPGEVALTRNTTESLDTIIAGYPWKKGDEAVFAIQDYGAMRQMFEVVAQRHGITNNIVSVPSHPKSDDELVQLYENAITPKTKLLMVCHMINISGHILPIRKICDMAHAHGVEVMVDGAHAIGHIPVDVKALDCDYYGSSLHKWLSVPLGAGLLFVKKEKIAQIWPLFGDTSKNPSDIMRINHTGTHPPATDLAVNDAIDYYEKLGPKLKEDRLRYLQQYWTTKVRDNENIIVNTPKEPHRSCGIANVGIKGMDPNVMAKRLLNEFNIWTVGINSPGVVGCRITPNIYTLTKELDAFVLALEALAD
jgi:selenocysteine lyase/cysteine desulfurase